MFIKVELKDHEDKLHRNVKLPLQSETTIEQLQEEIRSVFQIEPTNQEMTDRNGRRVDLLIGTLNEVEIKDGETLVLKHALILQWPYYLSIVQQFREATNNKIKKDTAIEADETSKELKEVGIFKAYISLATEWLGIRREYVTFLDNVPTFIREAAKSFFIRKFSDKLIDVEFKNKPSGTYKLSLLTQILGLSDLNHENFGFNENTASLYIVDFQIGFIDGSVGFEGLHRPKSALSLVSKLKMNLGRFLDFVKGMTFEEQHKIAKECIVQWEISSKLDIALAKLDEGKEVFNRADLLFDKGTETLKEYISFIREKINKINEL